MSLNEFLCDPGCIIAYQSHIISGSVIDDQVMALAILILLTPWLVAILQANRQIHADVLFPFWRPTPDLKSNSTLILSKPR